MLAPQRSLLADFTNLGKAIAQAGAASGVPEYPWLAAVLYELPLALGASTWTQYYSSMVALFLVVDAAFALCLWRAGGRRASSGFVAWLLLFPAIGPLLVTRFDIMPAALAACALLARSASRPVLAGALATAGCGLKLWPALALPALLVPGGRRERRDIIAGAVLTGLLLGALTVVAVGAERLWSPFYFQARRGLQVEAFAALPLLWAHHIAGHADTMIVYAECKCHEIHGPGTGAALLLASSALLLGAAGLALLYARAFRAPEAVRTTSLALQLIVLSVIVWIATGKVFSPQYLLWVAAPLAALGVLPGRQLPRADIALLLLACALSQFVFPSHYSPLILGGDDAARVLSALTLRDLLLLALGARLAARIWRSTSRREAPASA
jgi:hypothetical protein